MDGEETFPDDLNGDVLRRLQRSGDDFSIPRDVDFSIVFPDQDRAEAFASMARAAGYEATVKKSGVRPERPWDVTIVKYMFLTHAGITGFEMELEAAISPLDGRNDGWGCMAQNSAAAANREN
ncbi:MAG TPA: ribonuclease E inhibitor RraB [Dongiaceae bacterium]|nr:ribonuclease E inhibitor RraB [Dongiaceae bacterium]